MKRFIGYVEAVNGVGAFVKSKAATAKDFEAQINRLALGYRVHSVWEEFAFRRLRLIWTVSAARIAELEAARAASNPLKLSLLSAPINPEYVSCRSEDIRPSAWSLVAALMVSFGLAFYFIISETSISIFNG